MEKVQIVGLGLTTVDILMRLAVMPSWELEQGSQIQEMRFDGGGPSATAMVAASRLGARTGFVGTAGDDEIGRLKLFYLQRYGVDTSQVVLLPSPEKHVILVYVHAETGERIFSADRNWEHCELLPDRLNREYITSADYLLIDGWMNQSGQQAARWMRAAGKTVVMDGSRTKDKVGEDLAETVRLTDILICGSGFGAGLTGKTGMHQVGREILKMGPKIVVQTEGEDGCYTTTADEEFHTPAFKVNVVDTTGAGDVFHGAYIVGLQQGWDLHQTARFATAVSAIKCTRIGGRSGLPDFSETIKFLEQHPQD